MSAHGQHGATLLYAARRVGRLSVLNIGTKLAWAGGVAGAMVLDARLWLYAVAAAVGEALRLGVSIASVRR